MTKSSLSSLKIKAKLLQKAKLKSGKVFALKEAYALIAKSAQYDSWKEMKDDYEKSDLFNPHTWSAQWKTWYATREEARAHLKAGHYLIPYRRQFFICDIDYLNALGVKENDPVLLRVGRDWTAPADRAAYENLLLKIKMHHEKRK